MAPDLWGIVLIVVGGAAVVFVGWRRDRVRAREALARLRSAPQGAVPGWDGSSPRYLLEADLAPTASGGSREPTYAEEDLLVRREDAPTIPCGAPSGSFLNYPRRGLAILTEPLVLVCTGRMAGVRETLTVLGVAAQRGRPLVWIAEDFDDVVLDSLRANTVACKVQCLPLTLSDDGLVRAVARVTGAGVVSRDDLVAGYLPEAVWGRCDGWIADLDDSWVIPAGERGTPRQKSPEHLNLHSRVLARFSATKCWRPAFDKSGLFAPLRRGPHRPVVGGLALLLSDYRGARRTTIL